MSKCGSRLLAISKMVVNSVAKKKSIDYLLNDQKNA